MFYRIDSRFICHEKRGDRWLKNNLKITFLNLQDPHSNEGWANYIGPKAEEKVYEKLKQFFNRNIDIYKNVIVFAGWEDQEIVGKNIQREFDFFILSAMSRRIIHVEVKNLYVEKNFVKATNQLAKGFEMFAKERFAFPAQMGWKYVKAVYFDKEFKAEEICPDCQKYVFTSDSNMDSFLEEHLSPLQNVLRADDVYLDIIKLFMFVMFQTPQPTIITIHDVTGYITRIGDEFMKPETIFLGQEQLNFVSEKAKKKRCQLHEYFMSSFTDYFSLCL